MGKINQLKKKETNKMQKKFYNIVVEVFKKNYFRMWKFKSRVIVDIQNAKMQKLIDFEI